MIWCIYSRSVDFALWERQSSTHLDGIASPMLNRRRHTSHQESRLLTPSISGSPVLSRRSSATLSKHPQSSDVMTQERRFQKSMPNLLAINGETVRSSPRKLSAHLRPTALPVSKAKDDGLKSRSETSLHVPESPVSQGRAVTDCTRHKALVNQHRKPISKSWTQLSHSENTSNT